MLSFFTRKECSKREQYVVELLYLEILNNATQLVCIDPIHSRNFFLTQSVLNALVFFVAVNNISGL